MLENSPYRRVWRTIPRYRTPLAAGVASLLASRVLAVCAPRLLREALGALERGGAEAAARAIRAGWLFLAVSAMAGFFTYLMRRLIVGTSRRVERDLKEDLFAHVERLPVAFFDRMRTGDLIARLTNDVEAVRFSLGPGFMYIGETLVLFPVALASMMELSWRVTLAALMPLAGLVVVVRWLAPGVMRRSRAVQDRIGDLSARAQESFAGARVVRAYATEEIELAAFRAANEALIRETLGLARVRGILLACLYSLGGTAQLVVLLYGGVLVMRRELILGDLAAFLAYVAMLIWPLVRVGWVVSSLQRAAAAIGRINEIFRVGPAADTIGPPSPLPEALDGRIEIRDLTFTYPGADRPALEGVRLTVPAGGTLGLVGPVGAGKSTLLALLARLHEPPPGTVFLDGIDITRIPLGRLRAALAPVPQEAFLFSDTIRGNVAYATADDVSEDRVRDVLDRAGLLAEVEEFPQGLDTLVGERGITLSGGQRQRTTLARALLVDDAPVMLLDDCLSAVDTQTESRILRRLGASIARRTAVIVTHRLSTVRDADRIVVLDTGRVLEEGTHEELLARGGWYARTHAAQRLEAELEDLP